ncbi:MAG: aminomethyltransferase beta-barrel domain-containing protein [Candidatus Saccharibacteria bacterium]
MDKNEIYVTTDLQDDRLWHRELTITDLHWINEPPVSGKTYQVRTRYRRPPHRLRNRPRGRTYRAGSDTFARRNPGYYAGQSAVVYEGDRVVGGGIVI